MKVLLVYDRFRDLDSLSADGESPLYTALKHNQKDIAKYLISAMADPSKGKPISALSCCREKDILELVVETKKLIIKENLPVVASEGHLVQLQAENTKRSSMVSASLHAAVSALALSSVDSGKLSSKKKTSEAGRKSTATAINIALNSCFNCQTKETRPDEFRSCSKCNKVAYCSQVCQKIDWTARHKKVCK